MNVQGVDNFIYGSFQKIDPAARLGRGRFHALKNIVEMRRDFINIVWYAATSGVLPRQVIVDILRESHFELT